MAQVDSAMVTADQLKALFAARTAKIRSDLEDFVRGSRTRVDLEDPLPAASPAEISSLAAPKRKGERDKSKIRVVQQLKGAVRQQPHAQRWIAHGGRGGLYWVPLTSGSAGDVVFGVEWENPYLSIPKQAGYNVTALNGPGWQDDEKERWYDFGPVDLADAEQTNLLVARALELLVSIKRADEAE